VNQAKHATHASGPATVIWECGAVLANYIVAVCVNLTQACVNLTQVGVNPTQACVNLTQVEEAGGGVLAAGQSVRGMQVLELGAGTVPAPPLSA
jgi:hypothetical protein